MLSIDGIIFSIQQHGGITVYFKELLKCMSSMEIDFKLTVEHPCRQGVHEVDSGLVLKQSSRSLERYRRCRIPDNTSVFHSSYYRMPRTPGVATVVTVHDFIYERYYSGPRKWIHTAQKYASIRAAQSIICVSEATREDLIRFVGVSPDQDVTVIHNGVSELFKKKQMPSPDVPFLIFVGQRAGYKNFSLVLKAMEFLPDLELICIGGGEFKPAELMGVHSSASRRVRHLGFVSDSDLNNLYNQAVCLVYPSEYEGFGIPVLEAMRAGCPVVSIGCKAVVEVGSAALTIAEQSDPRALADAVLITMSTDREKIIQMGSTVVAQFSWTKTHEKTLNVYRNLGISL